MYTQEVFPPKSEDRSFCGASVGHPCPERLRYLMFIQFLKT